MFTPGIDNIFHQDMYCWVQVQTEVMGDIHHYAWRARFRNQTVYIDKRDGERFADWTSSSAR